MNYQRICVCALILNVCTLLSAQQYQVKEVRAFRVEVGNALDACPDSVAYEWVTPYRHAVDSMRSPVLGECETPLWADRPESPLSNFVADALQEAACRWGTKTDMALCNMGGLRSFLPKGVVTYGDVLDVAPFENSLCILTLDGVTLMRLFEQIASVGGEGVSGVRLVISDGKLVSAKIGGRPVDMNRDYTIATLDYLAEGNDRMLALKDRKKIVHTGQSVRNIIMEAFRTRQLRGEKVTATIEGRIVVKEGGAS
jgi:2',3'-cyclic-nucleotide 2'-phosphodiesterase (5'-nucleotidase family)